MRTNREGNHGGKAMWAISVKKSETGIFLPCHKLFLTQYLFDKNFIAMPLLMAKIIKAKFKLETGKEYFEWKTILLSKSYENRQSARQFLQEQGLDKYIDFMMWTCSGQMLFTGNQEKV